MCSLHVKYCGGCRSEFDRVKWVRDLLTLMKQLDDRVELVEEEAQADIRLVVCGCSSQCIADQSGAYIIHAPYINGIRMKLSEMAAYLMAKENRGRARDKV